MMKKILFSAILALFLTSVVNAQEAEAAKKVYNEDIDPIEQIDQAVVRAKSDNKLSEDIKKEARVDSGFSVLRFV